MAIAFCALPSGEAIAVDGAPYVATSPGNIGETERVVEASGAYDVPQTPASPGSVGTGSSWADDAYRGIQELPVTSGDPDPLAAASNEIHGELGGTGRAIGTLPKFAKLGKLLMGGVAGFVAWEAGEYVIGKIFSPADTPTGQVWNLNGFTLIEPGGTVWGRCWTSACVHMTPQGYTNYTAPSDRAVRVYGATSGQNVFYYCPNYPGNTYRSSPQGMVGGIPQGASVVNLQLEPSVGVGTCGAYDWQSFVIVDPIDPGEFSPAGNPGGPGGPQVGNVSSSPCSLNWACPSSSSVNSKVADALNSGKYPMLSRYLDHQAEPSNYPDPTKPTTANRNNHRCDLSEPRYNNEGGNENPDPYEVVLGPLETSGRPSGAAGTPDPYLRWGSTSWDGDYLDNWAGWGFRHIRAKHGWSTDDQIATTTTLAAPAHTEEPDPTTMIYFGPEYSQQGAICERTVVVQYGADTGPKGIITSFGGYVGEAP